MSYFGIFGADGRLLRCCHTLSCWSGCERYCVRVYILLRERVVEEGWRVWGNQRYQEMQLEGTDTTYGFSRELFKSGANNGFLGSW